MYELRRNEAAIEALFEREQEFWHKNVMKRIAPDDEPSHDIAKRLRRTTGKQAEVDRDLALAVVTQRKAMKAQKEAVDAAEAALLLALGDAEYGVFDGGTLTYTETHRKAYSVEETTFRQLRIKDNGDKS